VTALGRCWLGPGLAGAGSPYVYVGDTPLSDVCPTGEFSGCGMRSAWLYEGCRHLLHGGSGVLGGAVGGFVAGFGDSGGEVEDGVVGYIAAGCYTDEEDSYLPAWMKVR